MKFALALAILIAQAGCGDNSTPASPDPLMPKTISFSTFEELRDRYQDLVGTTCSEIETPTADSYVQSVVCDAATDDVSSDRLMFELDGPSGGPEGVKRLTKLWVDSGTGGFAEVHADDWSWAVATASGKRFSDVAEQFEGASLD